MAGVLNQWQSRVGLFIWPGFFFPGMRRMIGGNYIQPVVQQGLPQCFSVFLCFNGRVAFDLVTQAS